MATKTIRLAHLTDIHVAESSETIVNALKVLSVAIPVIGGTIAAAIALIEKQPRDRRIPAAAIAILSGLVLGTAAVALSTRARRAIQYVVALAFLYNRSHGQNRLALLESLRQNKVDHLLITGDLTNTSHPAEFDRIKEELTRHGWEGNQVTILPGNHDRLSFPASTTFESAFGRSRYPLVKKLAPGVILAGLDSNLTESNHHLDQLVGNVRGHIAEEQIQKLEKKLDGIGDGLVVLALHHPPADRKAKDSGLPGGIGRWLDAGPVNADRLRAVLAGRNRLVLCGHTHPSEHHYDLAQGLWQGMGRAVCDAGKKQASYSIYDLRPGEPDSSWRTTVSFLTSRR